MAGQFVAELGCLCYDGRAGGKKLPPKPLEATLINCIHNDNLLNGLQSLGGPTVTCQTVMPPAWIVHYSVISLPLVSQDS